MPSGYVPGLPKEVSSGAPQWGTVEFVDNVTLWNEATTTLPAPADDEFYVCASSMASNTYHYVYGTSQHTTQTGTGIIHAHNGTNGWTSCFLDILTPRPGATWNTTVNHNKAGSYPAAECARFRFTGGFQRRPYQGLYNCGSSSSSTHAVYPRVNKGPYPGGVCVATISHKSSNPGTIGIDATSQAAGWIFPARTKYTEMTGLAYYILSTTKIETAPTVTFTNASYSPNCWIGMSAYIR